MLQGEQVDPDYVWRGAASQAAVLLSLHPGEGTLSRSSVANGFCQAINCVEGAAEGRDFDRWSVSLSRSPPATEATRRSLERLLDRMERKWDDRGEAALGVLSQCALRHAVIDWFDEQADDPELMRRRGLRPGEPLPRRLGLLDNDGRMPPVQRRESFGKLCRWLDDDNAFLAFLFPDGLPEDERTRLVADLAILREQPWMMRGVRRRGQDEGFNERYEPMDRQLVGG